MCTHTHRTGGIGGTGTERGDTQVARHLLAAPIGVNDGEQTDEKGGTHSRR